MFTFKKTLITIFVLSLFSCGSVNVKNPGKFDNPPSPPNNGHTTNNNTYDYTDDNSSYSFKDRISKTDTVQLIGSTNMELAERKEPNNKPFEYLNKYMSEYNDKLERFIDVPYGILYREDPNHTENSFDRYDKMKTPYSYVESATYSNNDKKVYNVENDMFNFLNAQENKKYNSLYKIVINKNYDINKDIKVNFFEIDTNIRDLNFIKRDFKNVQININNTNNNSSDHHAHGVISAFLDINKDFILNPNEKDSIKNFNVSLNDATNLLNNANSTGIISMSYGYPESNLEMSRYHPNGLYFDRIKSDKLFDGYQYFSNALYSDYYIENLQLRIRSLGNNDFNYSSRYFNNAGSKLFSVMSPELQKLARNDVILVKNIFSKNTAKNFSIINKGDESNSYNTLDINDNIIRYYEPELLLNTGGISFDSKPMLLRSYTVATEGLIKDYPANDNSYQIGSSFASPRVSRIAYEVKKKFPFLSYNQVKQVILTTAKRDSSGYLSDYVGWGIADLEAALRGPSQFNAGLIDEEKYYLGNIDKIFENYNVKKSTHNVYFWAEIPSGETYTFSNDITSGLKGDGRNKSYTVYTVKGDDFGRINVRPKTYRYKVPKVLDSEKDYYENVRQAGLRKAGFGTLILEGKQLYRTNTQVLEGILDLRNDSNSKYQVFENGVLKIGNKERARFDKKYSVTIFNDIINDGVVEFNSNTNLYNYNASKNSTTKINVGASKITANDFLVNGNLYFKLTKTTNVEELRNVIKANKLNLQYAKFINPFMKPLLVDTSLIEMVDRVTNNNRGQEDYKTLDSLKNDENQEYKLRNIPSYFDYANDFFDEYKNIARQWHYPTVTSSTFNPYDRRNGFKLNHENIKNLKITKDSTLFNLLNYKSESLDKAVSEIFTDTYSNIVLADIDKSNEIKKMILDNYKGDLKNKNNSFKFGVGVVKTLIDNPKYSKLNSILQGNIASFKTKATPNISVNTVASYLYGKGIIYNDFNNYNSYDNNTFTFGLGFDFNKYNINTSLSIFGNYNLNKGIRYMQDDTVKFDLNSYNIITNLDVSYKHKFKNNISIIPNIGYTNMVYGIHKFNENSNDINQSYLTKINTKHIIKNYVDMGIKLNYYISNINMFTKANLNININDENTLNVNTLDVNYNMNFKDLYRVKGDFELGVNYNNFDNTFEVKANYSTNNKIGIFASYEKRF